PSLPYSYQDDAGTLRFNRTDLLKHLNPVHVRHDQVQERHVRPVPFKLLKGIRTAHHRDHFVAMVTEHGSQQVAEHLFIVHCEDFRHIFPFSLRPVSPGPVSGCARTAYLTRSMLDSSGMCASHSIKANLLA